MTCRNKADICRSDGARRTVAHIKPRASARLCAVGVARQTQAQRIAANEEPSPSVPQTLPDGMITCVVEYVIDPSKVYAFEEFARRWMALVDRHGGTPHGYFLPGEGASDKAMALVSFPGLAAYERYRQRFGTDPDFVAADRIRDESGCVLRYERTSMPLHRSEMISAVPRQVCSRQDLTDRAKFTVRRWLGVHTGMAYVCDAGRRAAV